MKKEYNISAKLTLSLGEKIDELAAKHYKNKTAFIEEDWENHEKAIYNR